MNVRCEYIKLVTFALMKLGVLQMKLWHQSMTVCVVDCFTHSTPESGLHHNRQQAELRCAGSGFHFQINPGCVALGELASCKPALYLCAHLRFSKTKKLQS